MQRYLLEIDHIMSELQTRYALDCHSVEEHDLNIHWSATSCAVELDGFNPNVEAYASIHTFAATQGLICHPALSYVDFDQEEGFVIVLHGLSTWKDGWTRTTPHEPSRDEQLETLIYLFRMYLIRKPSPLTPACGKRSSYFVGCI